MSISIPRPGDDEKEGNSTSKQAIGKIYVEFEAAGSALLAAQKLGGRSFNQQLVGATFYDEDKYTKKVFE